MLQQIPITLLIASASLILFVVLSLLQSLRGQVRTGCFTTVLVSIVLFGVLAFVVLSAANDDPMTALARTVALANIAALVIVGVILWVIERRQSGQFASMYSRGIFSGVTGLLLLLALFAVPLVPNTILPIPTPTSITANTGGGQAVGANIVPTEPGVDITMTPMETLEPTQTRTPLPEPSPTRTRRAYVPPTITPTPQEVAVQERCGATVTINLNVRAEDTTDSPIVAIVPDGEYLSLFAKNTDGTWWRTEFQGQSGWVATDFLILDPICEVEPGR